MTLNELMEVDYPIRQALIEGILYEGTYLFVGPPKTGKSFCVAQICYCLAEGITIWGFKVRKTEVLYLALEDDYGRLQQRLSTMFGVEGSNNLHLAIRSEKMGEGLVEQINSFLTQHPETKLVVIDTLQKIRDESGDGYSYKNDYEVIVKFPDNYENLIDEVIRLRLENPSRSIDRCIFILEAEGNAPKGLLKRSTVQDRLQKNHCTPNGYNGVCSLPEYRY